jgi:selenocysteine-specific elongation factor
VMLLPAGRLARVRAVQVHDEPVERAPAGQRVAVNLTGVALDEVARGDVVVGGMPAGSADALSPRATFRIDAALEWFSERPQAGARVAVHHGTREVPARLAVLGGRYAQLRLEQPLVPVAGDRFVIRSLAPPDTLGGGTVLDPSPRRHGPSRGLTARLARLERGEPEPAPEPAPAAAPAREPAALGPVARAIEEELRAAGAEPPLDADLDAPAELAALRDAGRIVRLGPTMHVHVEPLAAVRARLVALLEGEGEVTLARFRDELGTSRKYAQALLEQFDRERLTVRRGEARVQRRSTSSRP